VGEADLISILEAAYALELDLPAWLEGIVHAARPHLDRGRGTLAYVYRIDQGGRIVREAQAQKGIDAGALELFSEGTDALPPEAVERTFRSLLTGTVADLGAEIQEKYERGLSPWGIRDNLTINGFNPAGPGLSVIALVPERKYLSRGEAFRYGRVARHLAAAIRPRTALASAAASTPPEAVLDWGGHVRHAEGEAKERSALEALREAVIAVDKARGPASRTRRSDRAMARARAVALVLAR